MPASARRSFRLRPGPRPPENDTENSSTPSAMAGMPPPPLASGRPKRRRCQAALCCLLAATASLSLSTGILRSGDGPMTMTAQAFLPLSASRRRASSIVPPCRRCTHSNCPDDLHARGRGREGCLAFARSRPADGIALRATRADSPSSSANYQSAPDLAGEDDPGTSASNDRRRGGRGGAANAPNAGSRSSHHRHDQGDSWLDRTTARLLDPPSSRGGRADRRDNQSYIPPGQLAPDDVSLITALMTSHARRSTVESALTCERLLKRVVDEVNEGNAGVRVTTKMYTVAMDAWAKSQRRPLPGSGAANVMAEGGSDRDDEGGKGGGENELGGGAQGGRFGFEGKRPEEKRAERGRRHGSSRGYERPRGPRHAGQNQLQLHPQQHPANSSLRRLPLGAAAQRAHRIHNSLVQTYKETGDVHLAPSTISYNAAINAWSKSYHPGGGEMAELLLGEMMREWRLGEPVAREDEEDDDDEEEEEGEGGRLPHVAASTGQEGPAEKRRRGNDRVKPDVVTFTAVIDAWVKCTALAHDYHYDRPPRSAPAGDSKDRNNNSSNDDINNGANPKSGDKSAHTERESYVEWKRSQAAKADELTRRAAERAKQLLGLMIALGHYDPERHSADGVDGDEGEIGMDKNVATQGGAGVETLPTPPPLDDCEPGMRPNCYTYSAVMNALAKSCSALRVVEGGGGGDSDGARSRRRGKLEQRDPAREAQDMLEDMIVKHARYRERVGEGGVWRGEDSGTGRTKYVNDDDDDWTPSLASRGKEESQILEKDETDGVTNGAVPKLEEWLDGSWSSASVPCEINLIHKASHTADGDRDDDEEATDPHWFDPRPDELTFPPNTINYNSVLNAWSRASRYDPAAAARAERILLERMERPSAEGGDDMEPDALSYSLVVHAWLRGCRGNSDDDYGRGETRSRGRTKAMNSGRAFYKRQDRRRQRRAEEEENNYTDGDRIRRAMGIIDRLEAWARKTHSHKVLRGSEGHGSDQGNGIDNSRSDAEEGDDANFTTSGEETDASFVGSRNIDRPSPPSSSSYSFRSHNKARDVDVEVYNSVLVAYSRERAGDHAADVMRLLDRMENLAEELDMPSVRPNQRSYSVALGVIANSATRANTSLKGYYDSVEEGKEGIRPDAGRRGDNNENVKSPKNKESKNNNNHQFNPLYAGRAAESILSRTLARGHRPDAYVFASVLNAYQRIPDGRLDAALAADAVVRGMESMHLHGRIDEPPDVFHYTMVCACWSRSGQGGVAGERCSEILRHMVERDRAGYPRVRPNIRTFNAVIDSHAYNGRMAEAEDMLLSMVDNYESSAARSMDGMEDDKLPVRPDSFSFNTVIQQWARARTPEGGRRAEALLDRMLKFHNDGNADVRPDERSFAYIIYHHTKGAGRTAPDAPDRALRLLRRMVGMYQRGYKELLPAHDNRTNPIFAFTSVIDAHSVLRRPDAGTVGDELLNAMTKLGERIDALRPNTYAFLSVLYGWSSCGSVDAGERATELLRRMERDMAEHPEASSMMKTTQRCYILAQTAWARGPSERKAEGALEVLEMMEENYANGNADAKPTTQAYSMVLNACAFADMVQNATGRLVKASTERQRMAFRIAKDTLDRVRSEPYPFVRPNAVIYGTFVKCCGRLDLPEDVKIEAATKAFEECCKAGIVSDFVLTQVRYALPPETFLEELRRNGYRDVDGRGKSVSRDGKRMRHIRVGELPEAWTRNANNKY